MISIFIFFIFLIDVDNKLLMNIGMLA